MVNYGGDEVSALVLDIGTSSVRAGHAGDDAPRAIIPTTYGYQNAPEADIEMGEAQDTPQPVQKSRDAHMHLGHNGPSLWRPNMEIQNPMADGLISDWEPVQKLIHHAVEDIMLCSPVEHPILCTEAPWNTPANRERMAEIMFEEFQVPAFYIANTGVLNTFAAGKGTALVVDIGQSMASVTPVVDGFVLRKGLVYSELPKLVHTHAKMLLTSQTQHRRGIELWPHQLIANKMPVEPHAPPRYTLRQDRINATTESWKLYAEAQEVDEWIQSVAGILDQGWNDQAAMQRQPRQYEFPTGFNTFFGPERYQVGEQFFWSQNNNPNLPKPIMHLIQDSLRACDPELHTVLMSNVVLTGGGSLFSGLSDRLHVEISRKFTHVKIHAPGNPVERRFGGWLGGSILASLGTFHQLWISKEEWLEHGKPIVAQRCK